MLEARSMYEWSALLKKQLIQYFSNINHGDYEKWSFSIEQLPQLKASSYSLNTDIVTIGGEKDTSQQEKKRLKEQLKTLMPWRKGPFNVFGLYIDAEWRSNLKWERLKGHIQPLSRRYILDIGCGNGYYAWRMLGENAAYVVGLDPTLLFLMQFTGLKKYLPDADVDMLPFGIQALPTFNLNFDTVFSMGVIYHRRYPIKHLQKLFNCLTRGGELVLETLIIESDKVDVFVPDGCYAKMNNVRCIPNHKKLLDWVSQAGFINARIIDISRTSPQEQRATEWMQFESLSDFLNQKDENKTIEGYPAPTRAILLAESP